MDDNGSYCIADVLLNKAVCDVVCNSYVVRDPNTLDSSTINEIIVFPFLEHLPNIVSAGAYLDCGACCIAPQFKSPW